MSAPVEWLLFALSLLLMPIFTIGLIRKMKAIWQNRVGPPLLQPLFHLLKLLKKSETISEDTSWIFRVAPVLNLTVALALALLVPWVCFKPGMAGDDLFLVIYLFAGMRFLAILSALDAGSPFGAFSGSREATLAILVEPAVILSLASLGIGAHTSSMGEIFDFAAANRPLDVPLWLLAGLGLFLASLVELSRMPVDDPTTHLELTMVHEAMVIENSGPNLALVELAYAVRMVVLFGLCGQCFLHALASLVPLSSQALAVLSILMVGGLALATASIETFAVKLRWNKVPEFIAYALTMSLLACLCAMLKVVLP